MHMFKIVGSWLGGLFLMALGAAWLGVAYYLTGFGPLSPMPTVLGLTVLGGLAFIGGLIALVRGLTSTARRAALPEGSAGWRDDGERSESDSGFDADAAIARYLHNRPSADDAPEAVAAPPRPSFGRKQV